MATQIILFGIPIIVREGANGGRDLPKSIGYFSKNLNKFLEDLVH